MKSSRCSLLADKYKDLVSLSFDLKKAIKTQDRNLSKKIRESIKQAAEAYDFENVTLERAYEIMGRDCMGPKEVGKALDFELSADKIPTVPFTSLELKQAKDLGEILILQWPQDGFGNNFTLGRLEAETRFDFQQKGGGKIFRDKRRLSRHEFFHEEDLLNKGWRLVPKQVVPGSLDKNYLQQELAIIDYIKKTIIKPRQYFGNNFLESILITAEKDLQSKKRELLRVDALGDKKAAEFLSRLLVSQYFRPTITEVIYQYIVYFMNTGERLWQGVNFHTKSITREGDFFRVGDPTADGIVALPDSRQFHKPFIGAIYNR